LNGSPCSFGQILRNGDECEQELSHDEIVANMRVIITAGSDTTATTLCGATWYLLTHPSTLQRVQSEVRTAFTRPEDITLRSVSQTETLPFLNAIIEETLRCYPPLPSTLPRITGPLGAVIDNRFVPANVCFLLLQL
jgi:cytochrome P450